MARYCPLFSGSSGNCTYVGTASGGVLVDVGVSARRIETALRQREMDPASIRAIFITHEHSDHIAGLRVLVKRYGIPVYASRGTREYLIAHGDLAPDAAGAALEPGVLALDDMEVTAFHTPHDAAESMGFCFALADDRRVAVATDMGRMTDEVRQAIAGCDLVHIESNHEIPLLENGPYPYFLKQRILSDRGHLSNGACAGELPGLARQGTTRFVLAHLSRENNMPDLAYRAADAALTGAGLRRGSDFLLRVAQPEWEGETVIF